MTARSGRIALLAALTILASCDSPAAPEPDQAAAPGMGVGLRSLVTGSYVANVAVPPGQILATYTLHGKVERDGETKGSFSFYADTPEGSIAFVGRIICMPVDETLKRAWIGATIVWNGSTRPTHQGAIHQEGQPIWFRIADRDGAPDRTTSLGFAGALGIPTSEAYCAARPWGNDGIAIQSGGLIIH